MDFKNADLHDVLRVLAEAEGINLFVDPSVQGKVTIHLNQVTFTDVLSLLAKEYKFIVEQKDNIYKISSDPALMLQIEEKDNLLTVTFNNAPLSRVLQEIVTITKQNIIFPPDARETLTLSVYSVDLPTLLTLLAEYTGYELQAKEEIFWFKKRAPEQIREGELLVQSKNGLLTVEARNVDINRVLDEISHQAGINILYGTDVRGPVNIQFKDLPVMTGLATMLEAHNFMLDRRADHLYVYKTQLHPNIRIFYHEETGLFSLEITNAPLNQVLGQLAQKAGVNLVLFSHVTYIINSILLSDVNLEEAFSYLLKGTPYVFQKTERAYIFGDGINLRPDTGDLLESRYHQLKYTSVEYVINNLPPHLPRSNIMIFNEQNALMMTAGNNMQQLLVEYLQEIDRPENQVFTEIIRLNHLKAESALGLMPARIPKQDVMIIEEANALAVTGTKMQINQVRRYLENIDLQNPLILFEIMVTQVSDRLGISLGLREAGAAGEGDKTDISWQSETLQVYLTGTISPGSAAARLVKAKLEAMIREGKAKLWANPQITTLSGHTANFNVTSRYPRSVAVTTVVPGPEGTTETQTAIKLIEVLTGIQISILPWVSASREITLEIKPKIMESVPDTLAGAEETPIPATSERSIEATVRVLDGDPIVIGGLIQTQESETINKVPILGDLPLIGALFRYKTINKEDTEFIIIITPHLLSGEYAGRQPEGSENNTENSSPVTIDIGLTPSEKESVPAENTSAENDNAGNTPSVHQDTPVEDVPDETTERVPVDKSIPTEEDHATNTPVDNIPTENEDDGVNEDKANDEQDEEEDDDEDKNETS